MKSKFSAAYKFVAASVLATMLAPVFAVGTRAQTMNKPNAKSLTEDQKVLHVLNRLGFGARPGDVERVKSMGVDKYIEQQLNPNRIDDAATEARLKNLDVLKMSNEELFAKYPNGQAVLRMVAKENGLTRSEAAQIRRKNQVKGAEMMENSAMTAPDAAKNVDESKVSAADRQKIQREVADIYRENGLGRPQQITQQLNASRIVRAVYSERQLNEAMVDFWTNHFNVYANKAATRWFLPEYDRDVIRPNALGNFKDLLLATAKSPAMLFYLDNFQSVSPNAAANNRRAGNGGGNRQLQRAVNNPQVRERIKARQGITDEQLDARIKRMQANQQAGNAANMPNAAPKPKRQQRGINENYAREIMELHTLGVEGGYTQADIGEIARAFTGWTINDPRGYRKFADGDAMQSERAARQARRLGLPEDAESGTFYFNERAHDKNSKTVLGQKIDEGGIKDGLKVLDVLVNHPSTAKFIARKLAVKFVSDTPDEALVARVADAFHKSKGDIKTTLRALFTDKEFFAPENYRAKIKTPFEVVASGMRVVGAETNGVGVQSLLGKMGEPLYGYQAPTGYPDTAEDWVNTGALLERMNFSVALASNRIPGTRVDLAKFAAKNKAEVLNKSVAAVLGGEIAANTRAMLLKQIEQPLIEPKLPVEAEEASMENAAMMRPAGGGGGRRGGGRQARLLAPSGNAEVFKVVGLILGSPDFQRQ